MKTIIEIIDNNYEKIEICECKSSLFETLQIVNQATDIICGTNRLRFSKTGWMAVDFQKNKIDIQVDFK